MAHEQARTRWMALLRSDSPGGALLRRTLPMILLAPPILGWLRLVGERSGWFSQSIGVTLMVVAMSAGFALLVGWNSVLLNRADATRRRAEEELRASNAALQREVGERKQAEAELRKAQEELEQRVQDRTSELATANQSLHTELAARKRAEEVIRELSTPVLKVREGLLIMPLIGVIDSVRAFQLTEQLLANVRASRAKVAVIDITGVPVVDSRVASHIIQTIDAARLMGTTAIITGLSSDIARTLVGLGLDLSKLRTVGDLQSGLEVAERLLGYEVRMLEEAAA